MGRTKLYQVTDVDAEQKKINILRIIFSLIFLYREFFVVYAGHYYYNLFLFDLIGIVYLVLGVFLAIGFFTPVVSVIIIIVCNVLDYKFGTATLGTNIFRFMLIGMLFLNTGTKYSIDNYILNKFPNSFLASAVRKIYTIIGYPNAEQIRLVYFLLFLTYAFISFSAMLFHSSDPMWMKGETVHAMLTSSYLCTYYDFFRAIERDYPLILEFISVLAGIGQSLFQLLMIPLIFLRIGRLFVVIWGLMFFVLSFFLLQLSYLPHLEFVLWAMIFINPVQKNEIQILFDDYCNLCRRTVDFFSNTDFGNNIIFKPLSKNKEILNKYSLDFIKVQNDIHGIYNDKIFIGFDLYYLIIKKNILLWIFFPFFYIGRITGIGKIIYQFIESNRIKYFGKCDVSFVDKIRMSSKLDLEHSARMSIKYYSVVWILLLLTFVLKFPIINVYTESLKPLFRYIYYIGIDSPNVFNHIDITMGDTWYLMYKTSKDSHNPKLVPINGYNGERLEYHKSDVLYFGNSLRYRRGIIDTTILKFHDDEGYGFYLLSKIAIYDYRLTENSSTKKYYFDVFENNGAKMDIDVTKKYIPKKIYSDTFYIYGGRIIYH